MPAGRRLGASGAPPSPAATFLRSSLAFTQIARFSMDGLWPRIAKRILGCTSGESSGAVLTSLDQKDLSRLGVTRPLKVQVHHLAKMAHAARLDGVISSVEEARSIKKACGREFQVVTPGIRLAKASDDQKRVQTPREAVMNGADFFVMGRPVVESPDPVKTVQEIYQSFGRSR